MEEKKIDTKDNNSKEDINKALNTFLIKFVETIQEANKSNKEKEIKNIETIRRKFKELVLRLSKATKDFDIVLFIKELENYLEDNKRLLYSEFTSIIIELNKKNDNDQNVGIIITNLEKCIDYSMKEDNKVPENIQKTLIKLWDHANLASNQYNYFVMTDGAFVEKVRPLLEPKIDDLKNEYSSLSDEVENAKGELQSANDKVKELKHEITSDTIGLISIFVAISFVMFGGMTLLNGLFDFSNMKYVPVTELLCLGAMFGIIMLAIIYLFMYFVLRIIEKENKEHKFLNYIIVAVIVVLIGICFCTFDYWGKNPSINIYDNNIVETE